jgi:hypothetical protein
MNKIFFYMAVVEMPRTVSIKTLLFQNKEIYIYFCLVKNL